MLPVTEVRLDSLEPHPRNYRSHPDAQIARIAQAFERYGQYKNVVVHDGVILAGHGVVAGARAAGRETVGVVDVSHLSEADALGLLAWDNESPRGAVDAEDVLAALVAELAEADETLAELAAGTEERLAELLALAATGGDESEPPPAQMDRAAELQEKWNVQLGDLWEIGAHRLVCGDCTDAEVVERMMGGEKADAVVTDPPYGAGTYESDITIPYEFFANIRTQTDIFAVFGYPEDLCAFCVVTDLIPDEWVVWWPTNKNVARGTKLPKSSEHIAIFGEIKDPSRILRARSENRAGREIAIARGLDPDYCREDDVWIDPCPGGHFNASQRLHPNEKPCSVLEKLVLLCSDKGDIVLDPFVGSGTVIVACERLGRKARAIEISPAYCAVTLERLSQMGLDPTRL